MRMTQQAVWDGVKHLFPNSGKVKFGDGPSWEIYPYPDPELGPHSGMALYITPKVHGLLEAAGPERRRELLKQLARHVEAELRDPAELANFGTISLSEECLGN
jgi:hypothetical protein